MSLERVNPREEWERRLDARRRLDRILAQPAEKLADLAIVEDPIAKRLRETGIAGFVVDLDSSEQVGDRRFAGLTRILSEDDYGKVRAGYQCIVCANEHREGGLPVAWLETCPVCGFAIRRDQAAKLEKDNRPPTEVGENDAETAARWAWEKSERRWRRIGGHGILVPRNV